MPGVQQAGLPPFTDFHDAIARHVAAAGAQWGQYLVGSAIVTVEVDLYPQSSLPADSPRLLADTSSTMRDRSAVVGTQGGMNLVEFAAAHKVRTGAPIDPSGLPDVTIRIGENYLKQMLYFDPDPVHRVGPVPPDKTEAFGRFVHELGHALGFNGFYRGDGTYDPVALRSTFDRFIAVDASGSATFTGPLAMAAYGGPVPLTPGARGHLGSDTDPRLYAQAVAEVMNGGTAYTGTRYSVSDLDVRILCDIGVPCTLPAAYASAPTMQRQATATPTTMPTSTPATTATAVEYYDAAMDHYFVTALQDEIAKLDSGTMPGWSRTGESFPVYASGTGHTPVCRFFSASFAPRSSHFYTALANECAILAGNPDWQFEGKVYEVDLPDSAGNCGALAPLYRLYNDGQGGAPNHRYTTSTAVRASMMARGWIPEGMGSLGVVGCVPH